MFVDPSTTLVVARHGQSVLNTLTEEDKPFCLTEEAAERMRRIPDHLAPLTDLGQKEARFLGRHLRTPVPDGFHAIYHSSYRRSEHTAYLARLAQNQGNPRMLREPRLRERNPGYGYGMTRFQFDAQFPWMSQYWKRTGWFLARPPGGESVADLYDGRVRGALEDIGSRHLGERVLIVCHGRVMQVIALLMHDRGIIPKNPLPSPKNCSYTVYRSGTSRHYELPAQPLTP